ncbi:Os06g0553800 [Oryza sativa Japonica Group]|uniref:Early nodulin-like protein 17 n=1 Tax=Oryza sativa subsp. japonica TaxID=39947 RepID=ENL17_ORYSJ|nr:RecName: Full=Early nodulin-like protein 17; Short=OsENODL17; AltName: Full=Protein NEO-TETRAPLOID RICE FERTILITY RELATED GENE 3; Short=OsNRFG3; Flags: Precursor [Oryza sativa Japonica Group]BAD53679.1 NtEPc-like [Oryza sativa Japonica Group]BAF19759.1 Os06g0553800 [Oryza sativa Japonica Group]BAS98209.1 Os06g0553800 [Oryza sativa Japonica Group]|eukprot:NP_001057845.1 Os06g0553800 [Oryza sativa Japonica Group]
MARRDQLVSFLCFFLIVSAVAGGLCVSATVLPMRVGKQYVVGGRSGWRTPPPASVDLYAKWAAGIRFYVADSIEFVYKNDSVVKVDKFGYYHCNATAAAANDGSVLFLLDAPGFAYFSSADADHCKKGQRLMINVDSAPSPSPSPSPAPQEAATASAATSSSAATAAHALLLAAMAMMGLILGEW